MVVTMSSRGEDKDQFWDDYNWGKVRPIKREESIIAVVGCRLDNLSVSTTPGAEPSR